MIDRNYNPYYINEYLDYLDSALNLSPYTIVTNYSTIKNFFRFLKSGTEDKDVIIKDYSIDQLKEVKLEDIYRYLSYLKNEKNVCARTRCRKISTLRSFFRYMITKAKLLEKNPTENLEKPKVPKRLPKYLTLDESKKLLSVVRNRDSLQKERNIAIITLFLNCGMRLSELTNITLNDIDFEKETLTVVGKGNKERVIYLNQSCMKAVYDYLEVRPSEGIKQGDEKYLFINKHLVRLHSRRSCKNG